MVFDFYCAHILLARRHPGAQSLSLAVDVETPTQRPHYAGWMRGLARQTDVPVPEEGY